MLLQHNAFITHNEPFYARTRLLRQCKNGDVIFQGYKMVTSSCTVYLSPLSSNNAFLLTFFQKIKFGNHEKTKNQLVFNYNTNTVYSIVQWSTSTYCKGRLGQPSHLKSFCGDFCQTFFLVNCAGDKILQYNLRMCRSYQNFKSLLLRKNTLAGIENNMCLMEIDIIISANNG